MDIKPILTQVFAPAITAYWWLMLIIIVIAFMKTPFMKGVIGECQVNLAAKLFLDKQIYTLFKNLTLPTEDGSTQIDHVIVSRHGVFVVETKNMKGWIFGSAQQKMWTQQIFKQKTQFQNPLHQNFKHTQTLQSALEIEPGKLFSLVVFIGDSSFKTAMPDNVIDHGYIRFIKSKTDRLLSDVEVAAVCAKIQSGRLRPSIRTHIDHVQHVKSIVEQKQSLHDDKACPNCGKPMVLRTSRNDSHKANQFWGCSGYPKCRTVRQMT